MKKKGKPKSTIAQRKKSKNYRVQLSTISLGSIVAKGSALIARLAKASSNIVEGSVIIGSMEMALDAIVTHEGALIKMDGVATPS